MTDTSTATMASLSPGRYRLEANQSELHYSSKHMFGLGMVHATFSVRSGELRVGDPLATSVVEVTVDAASFSSGNARRDKDVRSAGLLDVERYGDITFASEGLQSTEDGWLVSGTVTAHGHTVPVDVRIDRVVNEGAGIRIHGRAERLDRTAFGITGSRGMVGRYLDLELDVLAIPA